jgi:ketosteroid isomerase-like protein
MSASKIVREYFAAYDGRYRETAELLLAEDFTFSSPQDDHIDRAAYFLRCWPNDTGKCDRKVWKVFEDGSEVFVTYECTRADGSIFRNTEFFHVEDGRIRHVDVYFGRDTAEKHTTAG